MNYDFAAIEKKWQANWEKTKPYAAVTGDKRPKFYGLIEFPYPSGQGLHVGHPRPFTAMDIVTRKKRMEGYNVLFPIGFDAFGLPTENYAIKNHIHPAVITKNNIANFTSQLKMLGYGFDWDRCVDEVNTCRDELLAEGRETGPMMLGCVVDMPSAAVMAGDMMEHGAQLMAVDIEDLTRYTLGLVQNPTAAVNQLTNPAVLRLVSGILEQAREHGAQVYLCGITVAAVDAMPAYLKLGIRTFSAEPAALLPLKKLLMEQEL